MEPETVMTESVSEAERVCEPTVAGELASNVTLKV